MRSIIIVVSAILLLSSFGCKTSSSVVQADETIIYLVRHAEKADDGTRNPPLTSEGALRSARLAKLLADKGISAVYSTDYLRTKYTAEPTAMMIGSTVNIYDPRKLQVIADDLKQMSGKAILVVGHSNTTPTLTNLILGEEKYEQLSEKEYGKIFRVELTPSGSSATILEY